MKGLMRFRKKEKLSPRYTGPYQIVRRVSNVAYELTLPPELVAIDLIFQVSMLKRCLRDPSLVVLIECVGVKDSLYCVEVKVQNTDRQVSKLRTKKITFVKVL